MKGRIYTKTGDKGMTSLFTGKRLSKADIRIESYGTVDELNANVGFLKESITLKNTKSLLEKIQRRLFSIGSDLASDPQKKRMSIDLREQDTIKLENAIDAMQEELPELRNFVLPGGNKVSAQAHLCRTVCRRAERRIVSLSNQSEVDEEILSYLNRLSDYFFVLSRYLVFKRKDEEVIWKPRSTEEE